MQLDYTNTDPLKVPVSPSVWDYTCLSVTGRNSMQSALQLTPGTLQQPGLTFQGRTRDGINSIDSGVMGVVLEGYQSQLFKSNSISWIDFKGNVTEVIGGATSNIVVTLPSTSGRLLNDSYVPPAGATGAPGPAGSINYNNGTGTSSFALTISPAPSSYAAGCSVWVRASTYNAGTSDTLNVNSQGAHPIITADGGSTGMISPPANTIRPNGIYAFIYDGTSWVLINPSYSIPHPPVFIPYETPSGAINGSNVTFTLYHTVPFNLQLFLNGLLLQLSINYTVSGNTITFTAAPPTNVPGTTTGQASYLAASYVFYS